MDSKPLASARFIDRSKLEKSINSLLGLIEGLAADQLLNRMEINFLERWLDEHADVCGSHPYNELMPCVVAAIHTGKFADQEKADLSWLCEQMRQTAYYDRAGADMQRLEEVLAGIIAGRAISVAELDGLHDWLVDHRELRACWPYDEIDSLVTEMLRDRKIDAAELWLLQQYFTEFADDSGDRTISMAPILAGGSIAGLCAVDPDIRFEGATFCFTGVSSHLSPAEFAHLTTERGGVLASDVSRSVDYLIVGAEGNPAWALACYGRKVQAATTLRRCGAKLLIVHEYDFHDAVANTPRLHGVASCGGLLARG